MSPCLHARVRRVAVVFVVAATIALGSRTAFAQNLVQLRVTPAAETVAVGDRRTYHATAIYSDDTTADVTSAAVWQSSNPGAADVDAAGALTAFAVGDAVVSAQYQGVTATVSVRVRGVDAFLYASIWGAPSGARGYRVDLISGGLTANLGTSPAGASPWGVAIDPSGRFVYVANRDDGTVSAYSIDAITGQLTAIGTLPTGGGSPTYAIVEPLGRFLYVGNSTGSSIGAFAIGPTGALTPIPGSPFAVPGFEAFAAHPSGDILYFSTRLDHRIAAYRIATDGSLSAVPGSPFWFDSAPQFNNLLGLAVHRTGRFLLASDNSTHSIRVFRIDEATGALTGQVFRFDDLWLWRSILAHPDGTHIIAAGQGNVHVFTIDLATGTLTPVTGSPFASPAAPQVLALDHSGTRLYGVNGGQSGTTFEAMQSVSAHDFDPVNGIVTSLAPVDSGGGLLLGVALAPDNGVGPALTDIDVTPADTTVVTTIFGLTRTFGAIGTYSDGRQGPLHGSTWTSSNTGVAEIDARTGIATIKGYGTTTITGSRSGVSGATSLTVETAPLTAVFVGPVTATASPGASYQFKATALYSDGATLDATATATWASSSLNVATVTNGLALAATAGTTTISATLDGFTASATLRVRSGTAIAYAIDRNAGKVYAYQRLGPGGQLTAVSGSPFTGVGTNPEGIALDSTGRLLYVADAATDRVFGFQVDGLTGKLVPIAGLPWPTRSGPMRIVIDPRGRFLYVLNRFDRRVSAYAIDPINGRLSPASVDQQVDNFPRSIGIDSSGRFLYVGSGQGTGNDRIHAYQIDQSTGALTTVANVPTGRVPEAIVSDPGGRFLYVAFFSENAIWRYAINPATGLPSSPTTVATASTPNRLAIHPGGQVLYVGLAAGGSLVAYVLDPVTGTFVSGASASVFGGVKDLTISAAGDILYVAGEFLTTYAVTAAGALNLIQNSDAGANPAGVAVGFLAPAAPVTLDAITVSPDSAAVFGKAPGGTRQFLAIGHYSDGSQAFLTTSATWSSSDPAAVSVSATGAATALVAQASVTISATVGAQSGTAAFTASNIPVRLAVSPIAETMAIGSTRTRRAVAVYADNTSEDVTAETDWTSSDPNVATVDNAGTVTGLTHGDVTISATYLGIVATATARVRGVDGYLYTSAWGVLTGVRGYRVDLVGGQLTGSVGDATAGNGPWGVAVDPGGRWVYVTNRDDDSVSAFTIDQPTGALALIGTYPTEGDAPKQVLVDPLGRFVFVGNELGRSIAAYSIGGDGSLTAVTGSPFDVPGVLSMAIHPTGDFLYFHTYVDHRIGAYRIAADGSIEPVPGSPFWFDDFGASSFFNGLAIDRSGRFLFGSDNPTASIRVFGLDVATGAVTGEVHRQFNVSLSRGIVAHPDGRHVIAAGQGDIKVFTLNGVTGALTSVAGSPFTSPSAPQALVIDHTGSKLYGVNGDNSGSIEGMRTISQHIVDPLSGVVTRIAALDTGRVLLGAAIAASNTPGPALGQITVQPATLTVETTVFDITRSFAAAGVYSDGRSGPLLGATWQSSDSSVAVIDPSTGTATLKGYGTTTITASRSGVQGAATLVVKPAPAVALYVAPLSTLVAPGGTRQFIATLLYADGISADVTAIADWTSSQHAVATVANGQATAGVAGTAMISASYGGFSASGRLTVRSGTTAIYSVDFFGARAFGYQRAPGLATLTPLNGSPFGGVGTNPEAVLLDPTGRLLFAADVSNHRVHVFQVDGLTGELVPAPGSPAVTRNNPSRLAIDPLGRFLYVANRGDRRLSAFAIEPNSGQLTPLTVDQPTPYFGRSLAIDAGGRFVFVGSGQGDGHDKITVYQIDQATGNLTSTGDFATGPFPTALVGDPSGRFLYVAEGGNNRVTRYAVNPGTGELTALDADPVGIFPLRLAIHPSGNVLYVGLSQGPGLAAFTISPTTGGLTQVAAVPVFGGFKSLAVDPLGEYLYVTGEQLAAYAVNGSGGLTKIQDYAAGSWPIDVTAGIAAPAAPVTLASVAIVPGDTTVFGSTPGRSRQFTLVGTYSDGSRAFLTTSAAWASSDPAAVSVSTAGLATALAVPASVTISAAIAAHTATATFTASPAATSISVLPRTDTLGVGITRRYQATAFFPDNTQEDVTAFTTWTSSNDQIASIDSFGVLTGVAVGDASITATYQGVTATAAARIRGLDAYLYLSAWGLPSGARGYRVDLTTGELTLPLGTGETGGAPWAIAVEPTGRWLYVTNREGDSVSAFAIDPATGALTLIATYPTGGDYPNTIVVDPESRFVFVGNMLGNSVAAYSIGADGSLNAVPGSPFAVPGVLSMAVHPSGDYLYFHTLLDHRLGAVRIAADGSLSPLPGSPFWFDDFGASSFFNGLTVDRSGHFLIGSDNPTHSIRVFRIQPSTGAVIGEAYRQLNLNVSRGILAHPNGRHVIAAAYDGINVFTLDAATGALAPVPGSPFASSFNPQALALDHTGTRLYGVNGDQSSSIPGAFSIVSVHSFDVSSGAVVRTAAINAGGVLMGLAMTAGTPPDTTPPAPPLITEHPADPSAPSTNPFTFGFTHGEAGVSFECRLDGSAYAACSSPKAYAGPLAPGPHTFGVRAYDGFGNRSGETVVTWTVHARYPVSFSNLTPSQAIMYGTPSIVLGGTISANGPVSPQAGDPVVVTINGRTLTTVLDEHGNFNIPISMVEVLITLVGTYPIEYAYPGTIDLEPGSNSDTTLTVTRRPASVTPDDAGKAYGPYESGPLTGTLQGFLAGDAIVATYYRDPGEEVAGSPYKIHATLAPADLLQNYDVTYNTANFWIERTFPFVSISYYFGVYDGQPHRGVVFVSGAFGEDLNALVDPGAMFTDAPGGMSQWTFSGNQNYFPTSGESWVIIEPAAATIVVNGFTGVFDGQPHGATGSATGVLGENLNAFLNLGATFTDVPGGTAHWTFGGNPNYLPASGDVSITITAAPPPAGGEGRMHGEGFLETEGAKHHFRFRVSGDNTPGSQRLEYWVTGPRGVKFEATSINTPRFTTGAAAFSGLGTVNGRSGYTFEATAIDRGEPGRRDTFALTIKDSTGAIVVNLSGTLAGGNIQSLGVEQ